ncbi:NAD(P)H-binding protein [Vibrio rarus]|uniref:NAD(P)H-binding protein n=1 Tax=Vibrio rarus TaxID=413403 RepID=UPI0021C26793|nr:NAD(P)H-binding protein [Vibrio rarus]
MGITKENIIIVGATGLIGLHVIETLLEHTHTLGTVYVPTRRPLPFTHTKLSPIINEDITQFSGVSASIGLICLGTTKKQAGSQHALYHVDHDLVLACARQMQNMGVKRIGIVSSYGANPASLSHYLRCKGEMERDIKQLAFDRVTFARPGPLLGKRASPRFDEMIVQKILRIVHPIMRGPLINLRSIPAKYVAQYLVFNMLDENHADGIHIAHYSQMISMKPDC